MEDHEGPEGSISMRLRNAFAVVNDKRLFLNCRTRLIVKTLNYRSVLTILRLNKEFIKAMLR